jgi:CheY-like chemotaxis protein
MIQPLPGNGAEGLQALEGTDHQFPRLVLLDMLMPVMDGWEFARRFRERYNRRVPIVVMTAATNAQERAAQVDADAFLGKPFDLDDLLACVERYTRDRT